MQKQMESLFALLTPLPPIVHKFSNEVIQAAEVQRSEDNSWIQVLFGPSLFNHHLTYP
jgi:hypothetical protein